MLLTIIYGWNLHPGLFSRKKKDECGWSTAVFLQRTIILNFAKYCTLKEIYCNSKRGRSECCLAGSYPFVHNQYAHILSISPPQLPFFLKAKHHSSALSLAEMCTLPTDDLLTWLLYFSMAQTPCKKEFNFCSLCHPFPLVASFFLHAISWWITTSYPHNLPQYFIKASLNLIATIAFQFLFY